jgi:nitrite reductase/ring-hydroxylating ferredoxin subunit
MAAKATIFGTARRLGVLLLAGLAGTSVHAQGLAGLLPVKPPASTGAPAISGNPVRAVLAGSFYEFRPAASDPNGDPLTYAVESLPRWAAFDPRTGRLYGTPTPGDVGRTRGIRISVSDGANTTSLGQFSIRVAGGTAPRIAGSPSTTAVVGQSYRFEPSATDDDRQKLRYAIVNKPGWARFDRSRGRLAGTPPKGSAGTYAGIGISVTDGASTASLPPFAITVATTGAATGAGTGTGTGTAAAALSISGKPATVASAGQAYSFVPTVSNSSKLALAFGIANKPGWASFDITTGKLSGTPSTANVGVYSNIVISASDGKVSATLPAFDIAVKGQVIGAAELYWSVPTLNEDGSALTNLAGYKIRYGTSPGSLSQVVDVANPAVTSAIIEGLAAGTWYFSLTSYTNNGVESAAAGPVYSTIG